MKRHSVDSFHRDPARQAIQRIVQLSKRQAAAGSPGKQSRKISAQELVDNELRQHLSIIQDSRIFHVLPPIPQPTPRSTSAVDRSSTPAAIAARPAAAAEARSRPSNSTLTPSATQGSISVDALSFLWALNVLRHYDPLLVPAAVLSILGLRLGPEFQGLKELDLPQLDSLLASLQVRCSYEFLQTYRPNSPSDCHLIQLCNDATYRD